MNKIVLAVVGLSGAGKSEATNYILKKTNWPKVYFGQITFDEMARQKLEINEINERATREGLRKKYGMGAYAVLSVPKIKELMETAEGVVIESLYSWEEYCEIRKEFGNQFKVLAIWASPETRVKRMSLRPERPLTPIEVESRDFSQIENLHQAGPIARADAMVINEETFEELSRDIDLAFEKLKIN